MFFFLFKTADDADKNGKTIDEEEGAAIHRKAAVKREQRRIWINIAAISVSFMCLFMAYGVVASLQVAFIGHPYCGDAYYIVLFYTEHHQQRKWAGHNRRGDRLRRSNHFVK